MLRPRPMTRVVITGLKSEEQSVIERLHALRCVEIIDYTEGDEGFTLGRPTEAAEKLSRDLITLRTMIKELDLEGAEARPVARSQLTPGLDARIAAMHREVSGVLHDRERAEAELKVIEQRLRELAPFAALALDLGSYRGLKSVRVFVGAVAKEVSEREVLDAAPDSLFHSAIGPDGRRYMCAFVPVENADEVMHILTASGFQELAVPAGEGSPAELRKEISSRRDELLSRLQDVESRLASLRERYRDVLIAAEEMLSAEVEKMEAPLRLASSRNAFVLDAWVPTSSLPEVERAISGTGALCLKVSRGEGEEEPVATSNPAVLSPFEGMVKLFSTPRYHEVDPTLVMSIFFPVFFGIMASDVGFGALLALVGALFVRGRTLGLESLAPRTALKQVGYVLLYGGTLGCILGLLVFAEMFGLPFQAEHEGALAWNIPMLVPSMHVEKFRNIGDLLVLSIIFAALHLGTGFILGIVNNIHHNRRHAVGKFGWLLILTGIASMILILAANLGNRVAVFLVSNLLFPLKVVSFGFGPMSIPAVSVVLTAVGIPVAIVGEGGIVLIEVFTLVSNTFSYARIAAIGVAEAGVHFGFNEMLLPPMLASYSSMDAVSLVALILLGVALVLAQMLVFVLGSFSAGIQALRLHFFEFFTKFYEGGGKEFSPFGKALKYVKEV